MLNHYARDALLVALRSGLLVYLQSPQSNIASIAAQATGASTLSPRPNTETRWDLRGTRAMLGVLTALKLLDYSPNERSWCTSETGRTFFGPSSMSIYSYYSKGAQDDILMAALENGSNGSQRSKEWMDGFIDMPTAIDVTKFMHHHGSSAAMYLAKSGLISALCITRLLDVGGGSGVYSSALTRHSKLDAAIFDLPNVCAVAMKEYLDGQGSGPVTAIPGNMWLDDWPKTFDAIFMSNIFHDWDDEQCTALATKAFAALPSGGYILLHEALVDESFGDNVLTALFSLLMFLKQRGMQRTFDEMRIILESAGFKNVSYQSTGHHMFHLVWAAKP